MQPKLIATREVDVRGRVYLPPKIIKNMDVSLPTALAFFYDEKTGRWYFEKSEKVILEADATKQSPKDSHQSPQKASVGVD